jgi:hypothetical protein
MAAADKSDTQPRTAGCRSRSRYAPLRATRLRSLPSTWRGNTRPRTREGGRAVTADCSTGSIPRDRLRPKIFCYSRRILLRGGTNLLRCYLFDKAIHQPCQSQLVLGSMRVTVNRAGRIEDHAR